MRRALVFVLMPACTFVRASALDDLEKVSTATCPTDAAELSDVTAISAGEHHVCAVRAAGGVVCWGRNDTGETGQPKATPRSAPYAVRLGKPHTAVSSGGAHTCARAADGTFTCWGSKGYGQMGDGLPRTFDETPPTTFSISGEAFVGDQAAAGKLNTYLLKGGAIYGAGSNDYGQLGLDPKSAVDKVIAIVGVQGTKLASYADAQFVCAMAADSVVCWGINDRNELGVEMTTFCGGATGCSWQSVAPLPKTFKHPARDLAVGAHHACALDALGALYCWGVSDAAQTGDTSNLPQTWAAHLVANMPPGRRIAAGGSHTCVVTESAEAWCMGSNAYGELGSTFPIVASGGNPTPRKVANLADVSDISAGGGFTCAVTCGRVRCWGKSNEGQLGASVGTDGFSHVPPP